jgi:DNA mismatch endonuclease (patch repair protein)
MQRVRRRDTPPEVAIRSLLHRRGFRFRVDFAPARSLRRRADIVFTRSRIAVFVDGCFWHGCPEHFTWPQANADWWRAKIEMTRRRDEDTVQRLSACGWTAVRVWAHEHPESAVTRIVDLLTAAAHEVTG